MVAWIGSSSRIFSQKRLASSSTSAFVSVTVNEEPPEVCSRLGGRGVGSRGMPKVYRRALLQALSGSEEVGEQCRRRLLELVVAAVSRRLVRPPALEGGA